MSVKENLKILEDRLSAQNDKDWDRFLEFHSESLVTHTPSSPEPIKGRESLGQFVIRFANAFPDLKVKTLNSFGEGDWVLAEEQQTGTNTGILIGPDGSESPPTNKSIHMRTANVFKIEAGKITEFHRYFDLLGFMAQLGLGP